MATIAVTGVAVATGGNELSFETMRKQILLASTIGLATLLTGCVGTGPNTQQGAVAGGALGALTGAIIGHNSGSGNTGSGALIGAAVGALAGGTLGNSVDNENGTVYGAGQPAPRTTTYRVVRQIPPTPPPPAVSEAIPPAPAPHAVWVIGYWSFDGSTYSWVPGHWEIPPGPGRTYVAAHWEDQGNGFFYVPAYWR